MGDPMIRVIERRPVSSGFWVQNFRGGDLLYADAHLEAGSAVTSAYPVMDRCDAYHVERAIDWILNAASASRDRVARAFRAIYPGSRVESEMLPSDWWGRQFDGVVGIDFSAYFGNEATNVNNRSRAGLVIDDSPATHSVAGFLGAWQSGNVFGSTRGDGPGGAISLGGGGSERGAGGSHGTFGAPRGFLSSLGSSNRRPGPIVPAAWAIVALITGRFDATNLAMGGGGGGGHTYVRGGNAGDGYVRISSDHINEATNHLLRGTAPLSNSGPGSGGGYYAVSGHGFTLASDTTIDLSGGQSPNTSQPGSGGNGRLTTFTVDQPTISGTVTNGEKTHFQIYPSIPLGAVRVM